MTTISDFDIFARVARTGNMSAAGRDMGVSPAVVSKRISLLEEKLGARLFQRTTRQLTLTEMGEGYFKRVVEILSLVAEADDFVSRRSSQPCGRLKVTAPTAFSCLHIAPLLPRFAERYPEIQLEVSVTDTFCDLVRDGLDLAIRIGELPDSSLVARKFCADKRIMCAAPSYLGRAGVPETIDDLEKLAILSSTAQDIWRLEGPEGAVNLRIRSQVWTNNGNFARQALLAGVGVGLRSLWEVSDLIRQGQLVQVLPDYRGPSHLGIYAVYPSRDFMPAKVHAFIEFLAQHFGGEPYWERADGLDGAQVLIHSSLDVPRKRLGKGGRKSELSSRSQ